MPEISIPLFEWREFPGLYRIPPSRQWPSPLVPATADKGRPSPLAPAADDEGLPPLALTPDCALHVWCACLVEDEEEGEWGEEDMIYATATTVATPPPWWR